MPTTPSLPSVPRSEHEQFAELWREVARRAVRVRDRALSDTDADPERLEALDGQVRRVRELAARWERDLRDAGPEEPVHVALDRCLDELQQALDGNDL
ncbi:hypothetical protein [Brachybacterium phenoliresistens]|uniref:hypothetical protein n=1 Tax=Brachybacterium phenoliresistens TaxID=396014 RepID=UPI0031E17395